MLEEAMGLDPESQATEVEYEDIENADEYPKASPGLPEAGGIAYADFYVSGFAISLTERRATGKMAMEALISSLQYAKERWGATGGPPKAQSTHPTTPPSHPEAHDENVFPVTAVRKILGKKGKMAGRPMFILTCAGLAGDGTTLTFEERLPEDAKQSHQMWEIGKDLSPPPSMNYVFLTQQGDRFNVVRFSDSP